MSGPELAPVDEAVLGVLVEAAFADADADEVTPPLSGSSVWTPERMHWLATHHRAGREGLDGPAQEATWAIMIGRDPVGAVRLKRTSEHGVVETGIWLTRSARGRGFGAAATQAVLSVARASGAKAVRAQTSESNVPAQAMLRGIGFNLAPPSSTGRVHGTLALRP